MGKKLPWMKFDLDDWNNDAELQMCSLEAQAFLLKVMGLMSRTSPPGYLRINGTLPPNKSLSRALKVHPKVCERCLRELLINGVLKYDGQDIYSQRMLSDWEEYNKAVSDGKKGGNPNLLNPPGKGGVKGSLYPELETEKELETETEYTEAFKTFWSAYPKKIEKRKAFKVWNARLKEKVDPQTLILAASNYAKVCERENTEERYIKHAATFIGPDRHYEDYQTVPGKAAPSMTCSTCGRWDSGYCTERKEETDKDARCAKWLPIMKGAQ